MAAIQCIGIAGFLHGVYLLMYLYKFIIIKSFLLSFFICIFFWGGGRENLGWEISVSHPSVPLYETLHTHTHTYTHSHAHTHTHTHAHTHRLIIYVCTCTLATHVIRALPKFPRCAGLVQYPAKVVLGN